MKILVLGACGQIGVELTIALRKKYGGEYVIASDVRDEHALLVGSGPYIQLDVMNREAVQNVVKTNGVTHVYLLAALLSATGEKDPQRAWELNMESLRGVLEIAVENALHVFWPSSIAVFGPTTPRDSTPQKTIIEPTTMYGITKYAGELLCQYYANRYDLDVRSIRYPGLISWKTPPGGGTTDYAVDIFYKAIESGTYECFLSEDTYLPMMYMDDAIRATMELMEAPKEKLSTHMAYNLSAMSFSPKEISEEIQKQFPDFTITYVPDHRQKIADSWPKSIDDSMARMDWGWKEEYDIPKMAETMLVNLRAKLDK